jgi:formylglycine-generating enzyme required for sulfatase activity
MPHCAVLGILVLFLAILMEPIQLLDSKPSAHAGEPEPGPSREGDPVTADARTWHESTTGMGFVWIDGGCFEMGNPDDNWRLMHEHPVHTVCLDGFYMARNEVTVAEFHHFKPDHQINTSSAKTASGHLPVVNVTWTEARAFALWLNRIHHDTYLFDLPSEAQWEYTCRAEGILETFWNRKFSDSCLYTNLKHHLLRVDHTNGQFELCDDGHPLLAPVGTLRPNEWGLNDMIGNVWEWCRDTYHMYAYRDHQDRNPVIEHGSPYKAIRGGSWRTPLVDARCSKRKYTAPDARMDNLGFRLIMRNNVPRAAHSDESALH